MSTELVLHPRTQLLVDRLSGNLPHALVIEGPSGSGVLATAKRLAHSMGSPELVILPKKKVKNEFVVSGEEGNIIIDDVRELYRQTRTAQPSAQVYILDTGERSMTTAAQNAFLKLLEEPRPRLYFIIVTHHPDQLLPTIMSRSQRLTLLPISDEQTAELLQDLSVTDPVKRARLAFVGNGLPALIKRLAADDKAYEARAGIMADAKTVLTGNTYDKLLIAHKYKDNRANAVTLVDDMDHQLRVVIQKQPDQKLVADIARHLTTRDKVLAGGNIRLQLAADMLQ